MKVVDYVIKAVCMSFRYEFVNNTKLICPVALTKIQICVEMVSKHLILILGKKILGDQKINTQHSLNIVC